MLNSNFENKRFLEIETTETTGNSHESLIKSINTNQIFSGLCTKCSSNGDLTITYGDAKCTMLRNEVTPVIQNDGLVHKATCQNKVGKILKFKVVKYENDIFYVSRKSVIDEIRKEYNDNLEIGQKLTGVITNIEESIGCFVDIGGDYIAMLPKRLLEHVFVNNITDHVSIGDVIDIVVHDIKRENNEITLITLSRIETLPPYSELIKEFETGDIVIGIVNQITAKSIFAQLTKHLNIMCRLSPTVRVSPGQKVRIKLKGIGSSIDRKLVGEIISTI